VAADEIHAIERAETAFPTHIAECEEDRYRNILNTEPSQPAGL
jgi:hypothetical protein